MATQSTNVIFVTFTQLTDSNCTDGCYARDIVGSYIIR